MKDRFPRYLPLLLALLILPRVSSLALPQEEEAQLPADSAVLEAYEATGVSEALAASLNLRKESLARLQRMQNLEAYQMEMDTLFALVDAFLADSSVQRFENNNIRELDQVESRAENFIAQLNDLLSRISGEAELLEEAATSVEQNRERWRLTLENLPEEELPETRRRRIQREMFQLDSVRSLLLDRVNSVMEEQDMFALKLGGLEELLLQLDEKRISLSEEIFKRNAPPFFRAFSELGTPGLFRAHLEQFRLAVKSDYLALRSDFSAPILVYLFFLLALVLAAQWFRLNYPKVLVLEAQAFTDLQEQLIRDLVAVVIFALTLFVRFVWPDLPPAFFFLNEILLMGATSFLVLRLTDPLAGSWFLVLVTLYIITFFYDLAYVPDILQRLLLMLLSFSALVLFVFMLRKDYGSWKERRNWVDRLFRLLTWIFSILLLFSLVANLAGAFALAEFFTLAPIQITALAVAILVATRVADLLLFMLFSGRTMQKLHIIREEFQQIHRKTLWLAELFLWLFFVTVALRLLRLKEPIFTWGRKIFTEGFKLGEVTLSLGNILIFFLVIWLSIMITRIITRVLDKDVFVRMEMAKGVPSTVLLLVRIALITGGFFLAARAAGMSLTNLSIVLGAFSVGIGFGLQNIFNNMVSGLILAFERPIKVGDIVQVGELTGVVRSIGLRSSTVRSFDGAEVIVPNGNLISNEMINWTRSDSNRRMDIRVGVAYGTDPQRVIDIMEEIGKGHEKVDQKPGPRGYFIGFGDSSLDFRLLAWTDIDHRLEVESEIKVAINTRLKEAGIEIPFPQHDLHIRSDATKGPS